MVKFHKAHSWMKSYRQTVVFSRDNLPDNLSGSKWSVLSTPPHKLINEVVFNVGRCGRAWGLKMM